MRHRKVVLIVLAILISIASIAFAIISIVKYNNIHVKLPIIGDVSKLTKDDVASITSDIDESISAEFGYGVERPISGELKSVSSNKSLGDLDFNDLEAGAKDKLLIVGQLAYESEEINTYLEKKEKEYHSTIDWTYGNLTNVQYDSLLAVCGLIEEDRLNENEAGRYTVEAKRPDINYLNAQGIDVMFDLDDENRMLIWVDLITRDSKTETEVEDVKLITVYYEAGTDILKIKQD